MKFKKNDKVRMLIDVPDGNRSILKGDTGKIIEIEETRDMSYLIYFDKKITGHSKDENCYWVRTTEIELLRIENWQERIE